MAKMKATTFEKIYRTAPWSPATLTIPFGQETVSLEVKPALPLAQTLEFIEDVVSKCIDMETGVYLPYLKDFLIRCNVLRYFADISLPQNVETCHACVYGTPVYSLVLEHVDPELLTLILHAIEEQLTLEVQRLQRKTKRDTVWDTLSDMMSPLTEQIQNLDWKAQLEQKKETAQSKATPAESRTV